SASRTTHRTGHAVPLDEARRSSRSEAERPIALTNQQASRTAATCAPPLWTAVTLSNRAGRHRAARHVRRRADQAGCRHRVAAGVSRLQVSIHLTKTGRSLSVRGALVW